MRVIRIEQPAFYAQAACRGQDPNKWVPADDKKSTSTQRHTCSDCPVRQPCLDYALADETLMGIWGGSSEADRERIRIRHNNRRHM